MCGSGPAKKREYVYSLRVSGRRKRARQTSEPLVAGIDFRLILEISQSACEVASECLLIDAAMAAKVEAVQATQQRNERRRDVALETTSINNPNAAGGFQIKQSSVLWGKETRKQNSPQV